PCPVQPARQAARHRGSRECSDLHCLALRCSATAGSCLSVRYTLWRGDVMTLVGKSLTLTIAGDDAAELADQLAVAANKAQLLGYTSVDVARRSAQIRLRVKITQMKRETSFAHALSYALGEVRRGTTESGGIIWDGTGVQIQLEAARQESA